MIRPTTDATHTRHQIDDQVGFDQWHRSSGTSGPRVVVVGGVHGDETEGVLAAGLLSSLPMTLLQGSLDVVPVCHEAAFGDDQRTSPLDGANLARVFPGAVDGTPTQRLAHALTSRILDGCDLLIDLHTSGQHYDMPFLAGFRRDSQRDPDGIGEAAARAINPDFLWLHEQRSVGRTLSVVDVGIYLESPGGGPTDADRVDDYANGVLRVLAGLEMVRLADLDRAVPSPRRHPVEVAGGGDLDRDMAGVHHDGYFIHAVGAGDAVEAGQELGHVRSVRGDVLETLTAERPGYVMAVKRRSRVKPGDLVVNLATPV